MELTKRQKLLLDFVKQQHGNQKRKYTLEPYWHHVYSVAEIVSVYEPDGIEAALGHDLFEDTECDWRKLDNQLIEIGYTSIESVKIYTVVHDLTDKYTKDHYPQLNRKQRKIKEAKRLGVINPLSQSIKYADLIHNTASIIEHDKGFARVYLSEIKDILNYMRKGNIDLFIDCCFTFKNAMNEIKKSNT